MPQDRGSPQVAVIGAGPAGLMAAEVLARGGVAVTVFERMPSPGRKLLLAGRGGLNLTHSEESSTFLQRYGTAASYLAPCLQRFSADDLRAWCAGLGIETFVGTSGRVFPASFKTSPLLRAWLRRLDAEGMRFRFRHRWSGWVGQSLRFDTPEGPVVIQADAVVLALGGASWPQLGADGAWVGTLRGAGVVPTPLRPANCGFLVPWSDLFRDRFEGQPLKAVALRFEGQVARGDATITRAGLEGGAIYALAPQLREAIGRDGEAVLEVALRPDLSDEALAGRLGKRRPKETLSNALRRTLGLVPAAIGLLREAVAAPPLADLDAAALAQRINAVPLRLTAPMPLDRAISTAGGIGIADLDGHLMLRKRPGTFAAGEMLDWEAPTGGYLLQACFATGVTAGEGALAWLGQAPAKVEADGPPQDVL